jgi:polar amino acid transport system substrate-binding protein
VRILLATLVCILALCYGSPLNAGDFWPLDIRKIKERGKIVVAQYSGEQLGFFAFDDVGEYPNESFYIFQGRRLIGCDIVLAVRIAQGLGVELELDRSSKDFNMVCQLVASGRADIGISKLSVALDRAQYLRFTSPYAVLRTGILIDRLSVSKSKIETNVLALCNHPGTRIGVLRASSYVDFAKGIFPKADLVQYSDLESMLKAVMRGEVLAIYGEELDILHRLNKNPMIALQLRFFPVPDFKDTIAIAVSPASPNLLAFINLFLDLKQMRTELKRFLNPTFKETR